MFRHWSHWVVLLIVVLLVFGANRLPDLARSVGQSLKIFKREVRELSEDDKPAAGGTPTEPTDGDGSAPKA